ncbi:MAG: ATP-binding protein [Gammaproteobacteria bacterium]|nr:ATP-binding protein [Gammaproteobacteria bacterium]
MKLLTRLCQDFVRIGLINPSLEDKPLAPGPFAQQNSLDMQNQLQSRLIFVLLALLLVVSLSLAWQAISSVSSHQRTVAAVLEDYSTLIIDDYVRALQIKVGYEGIYKAVGLLTSNGLIEGGRQTWEGVEIDVLLKDVELPAGWLQSVFIVGNSAQPQELYGKVDKNLAESIAKLSLPPEPPFEVVHLEQGSTTGLQVLIKSGETSGLVLVFKSAVVGEILKEVFAIARLLPAALGDTGALRPYIFLKVTDPAGRVVFKTGMSSTDGNRVSRTMDASYSGLYAGFTVTTSINSDVAEVLEIAESPWGSNMRIAVLLIIALLLGLLSFVLIRRERQLIEMRSDFIARVSHELRTPLTQIRMFTESILLDRLPDEESRARALKIIDRETLRLSRLVENILSFSKLWKQSVPAEPGSYNLCELLYRVKDEFELQLEASGDSLSIKCDESLEVDYNREAMTQVLTNLVDNAIKYGPEGQAISIIVSRESSHLKIDIVDQGPGIPAIEQKYIWQAYYRLKREKDRAISGTGIGLAVASDMSHEIGADLIVDSKGCGSVFSMVFESGASADG